MVSAGEVLGEFCGGFRLVAALSGRGGFAQDVCLAGGLGLDCRGALRGRYQAMAGFCRVLAVIFR